MFPYKPALRSASRGAAAPGPSYNRSVEGGGVGRGGGLDLTPQRWERPVRPVPPLPLRLPAGGGIAAGRASGLLSHWVNLDPQRHWSERERVRYSQSASGPGRAGKL